mmetsp:Transcript_89154/g.268094  ORF Transcript_89154/g.268094 Transcript_89154/m.268094 type:complete len:324 (-) Transcript_89154:32-1003(-)
MSLKRVSMSFFCAATPSLRTCCTNSPLEISPSPLESHSRISDLQFWLLESSFSPTSTPTGFSFCSSSATSASIRAAFRSASVASRARPARVRTSIAENCRRCISSFSRVMSVCSFCTSGTRAASFIVSPSAMGATIRSRSASGTSLSPSDRARSRHSSNEILPPLPHERDMSEIDFFCRQSVSPSCSAVVSASDFVLSLASATFACDCSRFSIRINACNSSAPLSLDKSSSTSSAKPPTGRSLPSSAEASPLSMSLPSLSPNARRELRRLSRPRLTRPCHVTSWSAPSEAGSAIIGWKGPLLRTHGCCGPSLLNSRVVRGSPT